MTNISKIAVLVACFGLTATGAVAQADLCPSLAWVTVEGEQVQLPADVAENVTILQSYGARYARAIALIVAENARPDWTFGPDCAASVDDRVASDG